MSYIDLSLKENPIRLAVVDNGDGTYSLSTAITISGSGVTVAISPPTVIAGAKTGQTTLSGSGVAMPISPDLPINCSLTVKAKTTNTGLIYVGNDGNNTVSNSTGFVLAAGDVIVYDNVSNLNKIYGTAAVAGEGICWAVLDI